MNDDLLPDRTLARNIRELDFHTRFTPANAPPAASNRALRREWAAVANRVLRATRDPDAARRAGAEMLVAALDCDALLQGGRRIRSLVNLPTANRRRARNHDGAANRAAEAILAEGRP